MGFENKFAEISEHGKRSKGMLTTVIMLGVILIVLPLALIITDPMFIIGKYNFRLENGTILHEILKEELECGRFEVYLFNVSNAEKFIAGEEHVLKLEEIGPFTYLEYRTNKDLELKDGVMRYTPQLRSEFVIEDSIGDPKDFTVTMPNIPVLSATTLLSKSPFFIRSLFNMMTKQLGSKSIITTSAYDYLWGYRDPVLTLANKLVPGLIHFETTGLMDRMYDQNAFYRLELGATDKDKFAVKSVKQYRRFKMGEFESYTESTENFTNTYEGIAYPPKMSKSNPINIYRIGICRTFDMIFTGTTTSEYGPDAFVYEMDKKAFTNGTLCDSKGFCPDGLMDMSPCYYGLPLAISKGHFLDADPKLLERVEGLKPDKNKHSSHLIIEPKIGLTLETALSIQVNIAMADVSYSAEASKFSDIVLPIAHFKIKQPRLPDIAIQALTLMYKTMPKILLCVEIMSFVLGIGLLGYSLLLVYQNSKITNKIYDATFKQAQLPLLNK